jgi:ketosteroid isomerase-like protein
MTTTSAETEANRETIRRAFAAWQDGSAPITDVFAPDMVWRIEGHSVASREYPDRQAFVDDVLAPFGARFADGLVVDGTAFYDSISFNDLWTG